MSEAESSRRAAKRRRMSTASASAAPQGPQDVDVVDTSSQQSNVLTNTAMTSTNAMNLPNDLRPTWPAGDVPVEIFNLIVQHLDRNDTQNMRRVNHEFDDKLAEIYFNTVVVPFRPEFEAIYGSLDIEPHQSGDQILSLVLKKKIEDPNPTSSERSLADDESLLSGGYRVFEQFGDKMRKFALALELNERDLAYPPLKPTQEIISAPWGLYRWPVMSYQRYTQLEDLEQLADETGYMKKAFHFLKDVSEIGISCDAGLGWLQGPDTNPFCARTGPAVFKPVVYEDGTSGNALTINNMEESPGLNSLKQMALRAGYSTSEWPQAILRLLEDEGRDGVIEWKDRIQPGGKIVRERVPTLPVDSSTTEDIIQHVEAVIKVDDESPLAGASDARFGLIPSDLTTAQAEMLLELEWAHRALMQSYQIAIMDNKDSFKNLSRLTIARCPSCHVKTWCNDAFWETMTSIQTFHLGVIPDWREITKDRYSAGSAVTQRRVLPVNACQVVFKLFQDFVGEQRNIKNVSFEWVGGGEFAVGKSQRDRYILPAPVLPEADMMILVQHTFAEADILHMPHVQKLSLKNCWFTPHVFLHFFKHMSLDALLEVALESVSLTGPPSLTPELSIYPGQQVKPLHWPWPLCAGAEPGNWFQLQRPNANNVGAAGMLPFLAAIGPVPNPPANQNFVGQALNQGNFGANNPTSSAVNSPNPPAQSGPIQHTNRWRAWSWPHVLASLGLAPAAVSQLLDGGSEADKTHWQNVKVLERRFSQRFKRILEDREDFRNHQTMTFKSCGYVLVEAPNIDNWKIIPDHAIQVQHHMELPARLKELDSQMLVSRNGMLAKVLNYMPDEEELQLRNTFGFGFGWGAIYESITLEVAVADGNPNPGQARFHGHTSNDPAFESEREKSSSKGKQVASGSS